MKTVLVVDDNAGDVLLLKLALKSYSRDVNLLVSYNGEVALNILKQNTDPPPAFILLDQNLPGLSGFEVLHEIRRIEPVKDIRVAMLSSAGMPPDNLVKTVPDKYIVKPNSFDHYTEVIHQVFDEWL